MIGRSDTPFVVETILFRLQRNRTKTFIATQVLWSIVGLLLLSLVAVPFDPESQFGLPGWIAATFQTLGPVAWVVGVLGIGAAALLLGRRVRDRWGPQKWLGPLDLEIDRDRVRLLHRRSERSLVESPASAVAFGVMRWRDVEGEDLDYVGPALVLEFPTFGPFAIACSNVALPVSTSGRVANPAYHLEGEAAARVVEALNEARARAAD